MKLTLSLPFLLLLIAACATTTSNQLPAGSYRLNGYSAEGKKIGGTIKIEVPFSDQRFAVGVLCSNKGTATVAATNAAGTVTTFSCVINGKPAT